MSERVITEENKGIMHLARLETNILFIMSDMLETLWVECENLNRQCGYMMRHEEKMHFKAFQANLRKFRGATRLLTPEDQESFGRDSDLALDLLYAAISRTGEDDYMMHKFLEYIMSYPDKIGLDKVRKGGESYEAIKQALAEGRIYTK